MQTYIKYSTFEELNKNDLESIKRIGGHLGAQVVKQQT